MQTFTINNFKRLFTFFSFQLGVNICSKEKKIYYNTFSSQMEQYSVDVRGKTIYWVVLVINYSTGSVVIVLQMYGSVS